MEIWSDERQAGHYRLRPLPRGFPESMWQEAQPKDSLLVENARSVFARGELLAPELFRALCRIGRGLNGADYLLSQVSTELLTPDKRYHDAVRAVALYGAFVGIRHIILQQHRARHGTYPISSEKDSRVRQLRVIIQQLLTRAWVVMSYPERMQILRGWQDDGLDAFALREDWNNICLGAARVATTAIAFRDLPVGWWNTYLPKIVEDEREACDLIVTGRGQLDDKPNARIGFAIQVKGARAHSVHPMISREQERPHGVEAKLWNDLQKLWPLCRRYTRLYYFVPALVQVGQRRREEEHNIYPRAEELARIVQDVYS